jgi:hypothetical protein
MQSNNQQRIVRRVVTAMGIVAAMLVVDGLSVAQEKSAAKTEADDSATPHTNTKSQAAPPKLPEPKGARRLSDKYPVWLDEKEKAVLVDGQIALREGMLEMFACTRNTKEHESIISANTKAQVVHAGLLALGADVGHPVQFVPRYRPPSGTEIEVLVRWLDEKGKLQTTRAQEWVKDLKTGKTMTYPFVFAGSGFWTDPETGKQHYKAEGGDFVCVSNFATAMLDIPARSSQSNEELEFEAVTKKIPPLGAPVRLVFKPKLTKAGSNAKGSRKNDESLKENRPKEAQRTPAGKAK